MKQLIKRILPYRVVRHVQIPQRLDEIQQTLVELRAILNQQHHTLLSLNHQIIYGGQAGLPLLIDLADRIRVDAETSIGAIHAIERMTTGGAQRIEAAIERVETWSAAMTSRESDA